jgi:hypothetical protein
VTFVVEGKAERPYNGDSLVISIFIFIFICEINNYIGKSLATVLQ